MFHGGNLRNAGFSHIFLAISSPQVKTRKSRVFNVNSISPFSIDLFGGGRKGGREGDTREICDVIWFSLAFFALFCLLDWSIDLLMMHIKWDRRLSPPMASPHEYRGGWKTKPSRRLSSFFFFFLSYCNSVLLRTYMHCCIALHCIACLLQYFT